MVVPSYFLGVDGGGSRCRARLRDREGRLLAAVEGGAANVSLDFDGAVATIRKCIDDALIIAGLDRSVSGQLRLGLGLAGASSRPVAERVEAALDGWAEARVVNDAVIACIGAHAGSDGGLVIAGTGSAGVARIAGVDRIVGGRGFTLGDDGSGARIGLEAWRRALRAHDGLEPASDFTRKLMAQYDDDPAAVIRWAQRARSSDYGAYAPATFAAASAADPIALDIVQQAGKALSELSLAVLRIGVQQLSMTGGIADAIRPYLASDVTEVLSTPRMDALEGAILLAGGPTRFWTPSRGALRISAA